MIRLYFKAVGWIALLVGRLAWSSPRVQDVVRRAVLWQIGLLGAAVAVWLFWDLLPLVAIGFIAWHLYQWRYGQEHW